MTDVPSVKPRLDAHIVLDRSGSMDSCRYEAINAVNLYVSELAKDDKVDSRVSVTIFDSGSIDLIRDRMPVAEFAPITESDYLPRSMTPLLDAVGKTIKSMEAQNLKDEVRRAVVIMTDGLENASREFTRDTLAALIKAKEAAGWLVTYLGSGHDSWQQAQTMGLRAAATMDFAECNIGETFGMAAANTSSYGASGMSASASYTSDQRARAMAPKGNVSKSVGNAPGSRVVKGVMTKTPGSPGYGNAVYVPVITKDDWAQVGDALPTIPKPSSVPDTWAAE